LKIAILDEIFISRFISEMIQDRAIVTRTPIGIGM